MNNTMFEWGKNCATLGYEWQRSKTCVDFFGEFSDDDWEQFTLGYRDGPRDNKEILPIDPNVRGK